MLTQPDRPKGRGRKLASSEVKQCAVRYDLRVEQPVELDDPAVAGDWGERPDVLVVVAFGLKLPPWMLAWPRVACINLHASLLPRWRGAAPIQYAILAGDAETGVSLMQMDAGLDSGPVYACSAVVIDDDATGASLHDELAELGARLLVDRLPDILNGRLQARPQNAGKVTVAPKIKKSEARLDWTESAEALERRIRAFDPWPVAEAELSDGRRLRIWKAEALASDCHEPPGQILACGPQGIDVATGRGVLRIQRLQPPSAKVMPVDAYLAGKDLRGAAFVA